jgi:predicted metalloprotease with PDZ domain
MAVAVGEVAEARSALERAGQQLLGEFRAQIDQARKDLTEARQFLVAVVQVAEEFRQGLGQLLPLLPEAAKHLRDVDKAAGAASRRLNAVGTAAGAASGELEAVRQEVRGARQDLRAVREETAEAEAGLTSVLEKLQETEQRIEAPPPLPPVEGGNRLGLTVEPGVVAADVLPGWPAAVAGLTVGDIIRSVNGSPVLAAVELRDVIQGLKDGEEVTLEVIRGGAPRDVTIRLDASGNGAASEGRNRLGVTLEPGVVVAEVMPGSPADAAGLARGDVVSAVNGEAVLTAEQLRQTVLPLPQRAVVRLQVARGREVREVQTQLDEPAADQST